MAIPGAPQAHVRAIGAASFVALVLLAVPTSFATADRTQPRPPSRATPVRVIRHVGPRTRHVEVAGDSLSWQTTPYEVADLTAAGFAPQVDAMWSQALDSAWIQDHIAAGIAAHADITVVESASNDAGHTWNRQQSIGWAGADATYRRQLEQAVDALTGAGQCVVVVDARDATKTATMYHLPEAAPHVNAVIASVAADHAGVVVVPWSTISRDHDEWFFTDGLHFGDLATGADFHPDGARAFAAAITAGVRASRGGAGRNTGARPPGAP